MDFLGHLVFLVDMWRTIFRERIRCLVGVLICCFMQTTGFSAEPLLDFETIRLLPTGAGRTGREFSCRAVVTYYNEDWPICFLQDALKHAFPGRSTGVIEIHLSLNEGGVCQLRVVDDGVGLPPGSEHRSGDSFGLRLVARLVAQLQGTLQRTEGTGGTGFLIEFKKTA